MPSAARKNVQRGTKKCDEDQDKTSIQTSGNCSLRAAVKMKVVNNHR